ncbi:TIM barrel protein [Clostridium ihumii]|uniref:TIM barrel protein n=1 Tax=Clostridium ihumii TaxID=1470356 RepID=UPI00058E663F|nr:TIM barrel protein [Clostridium ihumii]
MRLINMSTYRYDVERFKGDYKEIEKFLNQNSLDGVELLGVGALDEDIIPKRLIKGVHLSYYPIWVDFWNEDEEALKRQFKNDEEIKIYYGSLDKQVLIEKFRNEIKMADRIEAKYVVFHISHVELEETYNYKFKTSNEKVLKASVEFINEVLKGLDTKIEILFENLWWPGLTVLNRVETRNFIDKINYENKGIMLDTGHLINTNVNISSENEAIEYILKVLEDLKDVKSFIKGIHFNYSLSGDYVRAQIRKQRNDKSKFTLEEMKKNIHGHVINIDEHKPFRSYNAKKIVESVNPKYLTYEFITTSLNQLNEYVEIQNKVLL